LKSHRQGKADPVVRAARLAAARVCGY